MCNQMIEKNLSLEHKNLSYAKVSVLIAKRPMFSKQAKFLLNYGSFQSDSSSLKSTKHRFSNNKNETAKVIIFPAVYSFLYIQQ